MRPSPFTLLATIVATAIILLHFLPGASGQDTSWIAGAGTFQDPANWSSGVPDSKTNALFFGKTGTVTFTGNAATNVLGIVSESNVTFALGGHTYTMTDLNISLNAALTLQNGTLSTTSALIAGVAFGPSTLTVGSGAVFQVGLGGLIVGTTGDANLIIANGGQATAQSMIVSSAPGGTGFVDVQTGGSLQTGSTILGAAAGSDGTVNVGGTWTNSTSLIVGSAGTGELNIGHDGTDNTGDGGFVSSTSMTIGASTGGSGIVNIGENASLTSNIATIATAVGSAGTVNVGDGGTWTNHAMVTVGAVAGTGGNAEVNVDDGGLMRTLNLTVGNGGTVTQQGTGALLVANTGIEINTLSPPLQDLINDGGLFVASNGLSILNGGLLVATRAFIDSFNGQTTAQVTVSGAGSTLDLDGGDLVVGGFQNGSLAIGSGGLVESGEGVIGAEAGASGSVTVTGRDANDNASTWNIDGSLTVGNEGNGELTITGGGLVTTTGDAAIGAEATGSGSVLVTGAADPDDPQTASTLDIGGNLTIGSPLVNGAAVPEDEILATLMVTNGGLVVVNNGDGAVTVHSAGLLGGDGTIDGSVELFGRIAPGAPGMPRGLRITGDFETHAGSIINIEYSDEPLDLAEVFPNLDPALVNDLLTSGFVAVEGTATLADGTIVRIVRLAGGAAPGDSIIILHAEMGGLDPNDVPDLEFQGTFLITWVAELVEDNGEQYLVLTAQFDDEGFEDFIGGLTGNLRNVADALAEGELFDLLGALDPDDPEPGLITFLPLQHGAVAAQNIRAARLSHNSFLYEMDAYRATRRTGNGTERAFAAAQPNLPRISLGSSGEPIALGSLEPQSAWGGFIAGMGHWDSVDSRGADRLGHRARVFGGQGGVHFHVSPGFLIGIAGAYLNSDIRFRDGFGESEIHTVRIGPYLSWTPGLGELFIDAAVSYGYHRNEVDRETLLGTATSRYDAHDISALGQVGYDFVIQEHTVLTPMAGVEFTHLRTDSFRERGAGAANLNVASQTTESLRVRLGGKLAHAFEFGEHTIIPEVYGGWAHELLDRDVSLRSRFVAGGPNFTTRTLGVDRDAFQVAAGFTAMSGTYITLFVRYEGEFQSNRTSHGVVGGLNINF